MTPDETIDRLRLELRNCEEERTRMYIGFRKFYRYAEEFGWTLVTLQAQGEELTPRICTLLDEFRVDYRKAWGDE